MNSKYGYSLTALQRNISSLQHITDFMSNNYLNVSYTIREKKILPYIQVASLLYLQMRVI